MASRLRQSGAAITHSASSRHVGLDAHERPRLVFVAPLGLELAARLLVPVRARRPRQTGSMVVDRPAADRPPPWLRAYANEVPRDLDTRCITCTPPEHDPDVIVFTDHWKVVLHPDQTVAGACLIGGRRHAPKVSSLTAIEAADFFELYATIEPALERVLGADLVNLSCSRNWAYRELAPDPPWLDGHPNPHVHWHVAPRYRLPTTVAGEVFTDVRFGDELVWTGRRLDHRVRRELIDTIRGALPITFESSPAPPSPA